MRGCSNPLLPNTRVGVRGFKSINRERKIETTDHTETTDYQRVALAWQSTYRANFDHKSLFIRVLCVI